MLTTTYPAQAASRLIKQLTAKAGQITDHLPRLVVLLFLGSGILLLTHCASPAQEEAPAASAAQEAAAPPVEAAARQDDPAAAPSAPAVVPDVPALQLASAQRRTPQLVVDMRQEAGGERQLLMNQQQAPFRGRSAHFRIAPIPDGEGYRIFPQGEADLCLTFLDSGTGFTLGVQPCRMDDYLQQFRILDAGNGQVVIQPIHRANLFLAAPTEGQSPYFTANHHVPATRFLLLPPSD
jgi:hypothetical protein